MFWLMTSGSYLLLAVL
uniref:Uncharacterized protein n=1 Tax=Anguilla anguilla TaxID=7936 RepID=A0A0E9VQX9_ANGAN